MQHTQEGRKRTAAWCRQHTDGGAGTMAVSCMQHTEGGARTMAERHKACEALRPCVSMRDAVQRCMTHMQSSKRGRLPSACVCSHAHTQ
eukprot:scaffold267575_cov19-Tisochrysis_lutea.AAC.2